jgi:hypothetical protein
LREREREKDVVEIKNGFSSELLYRESAFSLGKHRSFYD